jgi:hypothetical protein
MAKRASSKKAKKATDNTDETFSAQGPSTPKDSSASQRKEEKLKQDGEYIEMPDVSDIPGQENITSAGVPGEMADTTIASDDEEGIREGKDLLEQDEVEIVMGTEADVTKDDLANLGDPDQDVDMGEDEMVLTEGLDDTDTDGDPLNEAAADDDTTGDDLDVPGEDQDDTRKDAMGQDDEENRYYSLGGDKD